MTRLYGPDIRTLPGFAIVCTLYEFILPQVVGVDRLHGSPMGAQEGCCAPDIPL